MLLSRIPGDPTFGRLRDKKEKCSTGRGLRVGTRFREFLQTPRDRIFSLLEFYSHLNVLPMFRLNEAVRGSLIGPKTWDRIDRIFERKMEQPVTAPRLLGAVWVWFVLTCVLNVCLVYIGPGMTVDCGFTK